MNNKDGVRIHVQSHLTLVLRGTLIVYSTIISYDTINAWKTESHIISGRLSVTNNFF